MKTKQELQSYLERPGMYYTASLAATNATNGFQTEAVYTMVSYTICIHDLRKCKNTTLHSCTK